MDADLYDRLIQHRLDRSSTVAFFFWLTCANEGWGLFLGLELVAVVVLFITSAGLGVFGIDIDDHDWLTVALVTWPLVAVLVFQVVTTYKRIDSRVKSNTKLPSNERHILSDNVVEKSETRPVSVSIAKIVERAAYVCRRYALRDAEGFAKEFKGIDDSIISTAWSIALDKVRDDEVIKVSPRREITKFIGQGIASEVVGKAEYEDDQTNFTYLMSKLDDSALSLVEEDREREIRRLLASRYFIRSRAVALGDFNELLGSFVSIKDNDK